MNTSEAELKAIAKAIGSSLKRAGHPVPHSNLLHAVAAALNKRDWHSLKASFDTKACTLPTKSRVQPRVYSPKTWFALRLAYAMGRPVAPLPQDDAVAREKALEACGPSFDGVLSHNGWVAPATLNLQTSRVDAGDFVAEPEVSSGMMEATFKHGIKLNFELGYVRESGWYLSRKGSEAAYEQLEAQVPEEALFEVTATESAAVSVSETGPSVEAAFWTDDKVFEVTFDASPYLAQASDATLEAIFNVGFVGSGCTDDAAIFVAESCENQELKEGFRYIEARQAAAGSYVIGFECQIDRDSYLRWMDSNRRLVLARILCTRADVSISEAQEAEIQGMWDWFDRMHQEGCPHSYETEEEALLAAYADLHLLDQALAEEI